MFVYFLWCKNFQKICIFYANFPEKRKRRLEGLGMYSMIDRLVKELDGDEIVYLRRQLAEHEHGEDRELSHSLETLLDERSEELDLLKSDKAQS